jgi:hypothetical protein
MRAFVSVKPVMRTRKLVALGLAVAVVAACKGDTTGGSGAPAPGTASIGPAGGVLDGPDGIVVTFPPGAVAAATTFTAGPARAIPPLPAPSDTYVSQVFSLEPHGFTFAAPVTVQFPITASGGGFEVIHPACATGTESCQPWDATPVAGAEVQAGMVTLQTPSFSLYAAVAPGQAPSDGGAPGDGGAPPLEGGPADGGTLVEGGPAIPFVDVSTTMGHACALTATGDVYCWDTVVGSAITPATQVAGLPGAMKAVATGNTPSGCAIDSTGGLWCWQGGNNTQGYNPLVPTRVPGLTSGATGVATGFNYTCAVAAGGTVLCWGMGDAIYPAGGTLDGDVYDGSPGSGAIYGVGSGATAVSAGWDDDGQSATVCALAAGGAVMCWGDNQAGKLGNSSDASPPYPPIGDVASPVSGLTSGATDVSAGKYSACAVNASGGALCWGSNSFNLLGNGSAGAQVFPSSTFSTAPVPVVGLSSGVTQVSVGGTGACALAAGGNVVCWGGLASSDAGNSPVPLPVPGLASGVSRVSVAPSDYACAVTADRRVVCWGYRYGATPVEIIP